MTKFGNLSNAGSNNRFSQYTLYLIIFFAVTLFLFFSPVLFAYDWSLVREAILRLFSRQEIYIMTETEGAKSGVFAPPWILLILSPLGFLPQKLGWALNNGLSVLVVLYAASRYQLNNWLKLLLLLSPPMLFNGIHGNLDALLLLLIFAPIEVMPLVALSKPQLLFGLVFKFLHQKPPIWVRTAVISGIVIGLSLLIFGLWPLKVLELSREQFANPVSRSPLSAIWPLQLVLAVGLIALGFERKDERFYLAASPFMFSYASTGSYLGLLLVLCSGLKPWQSSLIILSWWLVAIVASLSAG